MKRRWKRKIERVALHDLHHGERRSGSRLDRVSILLKIPLFCKGGGFLVFVIPG